MGSRFKVVDTPVNICVRHVLFIMEWPRGDSDEILETYIWDKPLEIK